MPRSSALPCILLAIIICLSGAAVVAAQQFVYNGFKDPRLMLVLGGQASVTKDGLLSLTNGGSNDIGGHTFYPVPLLMIDSEGRSPMASFSTTFVFTVAPYSSGDDIMAFLFSSATDFSGLFPEPSSSNLPRTNHSFFGILFGADLNKTAVSFGSAGYRYGNNLHYNFISPDQEALRLSSGKAVQLWADYDGKSMELNVTLASVHEPSSSLLSGTVNMSSLLLWDSSDVVFYVGFSASMGDSNRVLGWSFSLLGATAPVLDYSLLPWKGLEEAKNKMLMINLVKWLPASVISTLSILAGVAAACLVLRRRRCKESEEALEEASWEGELGPRRFPHKDLRKATNGFSSEQLLGQGGFGRVYGGELAGGSGTRIAVKRISSDSKQGLAQFTAEIVILGRLRHRNLVRLIGYCRHKDELLLVYDHMPNGSLDRYLHDQPKLALSWSQRFHVIKGVASGLLYLHEDWEQVTVHRDVKASNVLLDAEMNGRLGDFGLARLHDHGADAHTTAHVAGTRGYLAPELMRFGKATKATDVFAFGAFILEVACGRRPAGVNARGEPLVLVDWVRQVWASGGIVYAMDSRLRDCVADEAELVLRLGLLCSHPLPTARPGMRLVMQYLDGDLPLPEFLPDYLTSTDAYQVLVAESRSVAVSITSLSGGR